MANVIFENITKKFDDVTAVEDFSLEVQDKEFLVLLGPSGCGKTTTMRIVAGLEKPNSGKVLIDAKDVTDYAPKDRDVAMVFQSYALYPHMTVFQNIEYPLKIKNVPKEKRKDQVLETAKKVQLEGLLKRLPKQLSGGQQQRVALARVIIRNP
ncbi:MAG TPA: ABC transporter ATP-binding protein, partial [Pelagibacterales bacterium]|nr:ABC transporter ATP-binding protein [Pelagibacterales bacterium]